MPHVCASLSQAMWPFPPSPIHPSDLAAVCTIQHSNVRRLDVLRTTHARKLLYVSVVDEALIEFPQWY